MINERIIGTGAGADTVVPSEYFNTVLYTGNGGTQRVGGYINRGAVFNGSSSKIVNAGFNAITGNAARSISFWYKTTSNDDTIVTLGGTSGGNNTQFSIAPSSNSLAIYGFSGSYDEYITGWTNDLTSGEWTHLVVTWDGTTGGTLKAYLNGSQEVKTLVRGAGEVYATTAGLQLGNWGNNDRYYNGKLDQVRIFDKALSSDEVTTLYGETYESTTISTTDIFNDDSGVALYQLDGNANDTGLANSARKAIDTTDKAASFNGSSSRIALPKITGLTADVSVSGWVNLGNTTVTQRLRFVELNLDTNGHAGTLSVMYKPSNGEWLVRAGNGTSSDSNVLTHTYTLTQSTWYHISFTRDDYTNETKFYVNGSLQDTETVSVSSSYPSGATGTIGDLHYTASLDYNWLGQKDEIRIYSDVLTSDEVGYIYNNTTASIPTDNLVAYYNLDGNSNDTAGSNNGTDTNITYVQSTKKGVERIDSGAAAIFNGSSSYIDLGNSAPFGDRDDIKAISGWIKTNGTTDNNIHNAWLYSVSGTADAFDWFYVAYRPTNNKIYVYRRISSGNDALTTATITPDTNWHHIVAQLTATEVEIYLDGQKLTTTNTNNGTGSNTSWISYGAYGGTVKSMIGKSRQNTPSYTDGSIDDVRFYSDVLTSTEVGYLYNNTTASIPTDNLEAYYKLDGNALDSANSFDGTESNITYGFDGTASNVVYQEATKFTPDLVWIKNRDRSISHILTDSVRGATKTLRSELSNEEITSTNDLKSFDSNGFTVGSNTRVNYSNEDFVAWCFNAGTDAAASNTDGTITSTVKANQDAGFSIIKYTGDGNSSSTFGHGLNQTPDLYIHKDINNDGNDSLWGVYHVPTDKKVFLNLTNSGGDATGGGSNGLLGTNKATSTTLGFNAGSSSVNNVNSSGADYLVYAFHSVDGMQKVGSYTGTGGSVNVETGFEPAWIMIKRTDSTASGRNWSILDNARTPNNPREHYLLANTSDAEAENTSYDIEFASNGFNITSTSSPYNQSGATYIYLAIAADPDTTTPVVENSFDVVTWTGNSSTQSIDVSFKPDLIWVKDRSSALNHLIADTVRGISTDSSNTTKLLQSNSTNTELTNRSEIRNLNDNGFDVTGTASGSNTTNDNFVAWCFKAGDHDDNLPEINTEGTIDSVVSVNDASGFSIVKYTGENAARTVGHGLSQAPEMVMFKNLDDTRNWVVYHKDLSASSYLFLNLSNAEETDTRINGGQPRPFGPFTSTTFGVNIDNETGYTNNYIAYCFTSITGYQSVGSYTGLGSSDITVYTTGDGTSSGTGGFKPRFLLIKNYDSAGNWYIYDQLRDGTNDRQLYANTGGNESTTGDVITYNSDGFTVAASGSGVNSSTGEYIYLAIK